MTKLLPTPTPLLSEFPAAQGLVESNETAWLRLQGFRCEMAFQGVSASGQVRHQSQRLQRLSSSAPTLHRHEFWLHPDGGLAVVSFFQQGRSAQWYLNRAELFAFASLSRSRGQVHTPDTRWFPQPNGSVVAGWVGNGQEKMERVWGWAQQAKEVGELLAFSRWKEMQGRVLSLPLSSMLMDWSDVGIANPGKIPLEHERVASLRIVRSATALDRELVRHLSATALGPSPAFWRQTLRHDLASKLAMLQDHGLVPKRLSPLARGVLEDYLGVEEQLRLEGFHDGLNRLLGGVVEMHGFTQEQSGLVEEWYRWLHMPVAKFEQALPSLPVFKQVHGGDFLDLMCGFPFHPEAFEKIQSMLEAISPSTLQKRLSEEDSLGMNLTLRLLALANLGPSSGKEDNMDAAMSVPVGYQVLDALRKTTEGKCFTLQTSQWNALAFVFSAGALGSAYAVQRKKRHDLFLRWTEQCGLDVPPVLRFPGEASAQDVPLSHLSPSLIQRALTLLKGRSHPDFQVSCQPEDVTAMEELKNHLRQRVLDNALPSAMPVSKRLRF